MPVGLLPLPGRAYSVMAPVGVILPIWLAFSSVNQRLPSGPLTMVYSPLVAMGMGYSVIFPDGVMVPIWLLPLSVNQRLPSGPLVMPEGKLLAVGRAYSV